MLIIQRRVGERIVLSGGIEVTVAEIGRRGVRLALAVPDGVSVLRGEVHDAIVAANAAASAMPIDEPPPAAGSQPGRKQ